MSIQKNRKKDLCKNTGSTGGYPLDIFAASPIGIYIAVRGRFVFVNPRFQTLTGYSEEELLGRYTLDLVIPPDRALVREKAIQMLRGTLKNPYEYRIRDKKGNIRWILETVTSIDYQGQKATMGNFMDVTERKQVEEAYRESEERYRRLVNMLPDAVAVHTDGRIVYVNEHGVKLCGVKNADEIIGRNFLEFVHPDYHKIVKERVKAMKEGRGAPLIEEKFVRADGSVVDVEVAAVPLNYSGKLSFLVVIRDITERKRAERELQNSFRRLENIINGTITAMAKIVETKDPYTAGHHRRVARLATAIAREMNVDEEIINGIKMAALVHDIGKINIPAEILSKPGRLSEIEMEIIKTHPLHGYEILKFIDFPWPVAEIVLQHHELLDGSGYPYGLKKDEIRLEARILTVADIVEAISSHRPYRPSWGLEIALEEVMEGCGRLYDTDVVEACRSLLQKKDFVLNGDSEPWESSKAGLL